MRPIVIVAAFLLAAFASAVEPTPTEQRKEIIAALKAQYEKADAGEKARIRSLGEKDPKQVGESAMLKVGDFGRLGRGLFPKIDKVVDKTTVVILVNRYTTPTKFAKKPLLISGIDTSKMADGMGSPPDRVYYVAGNKKVDGKTYFELVPLLLTDEELDTITRK